MSDIDVSELLTVEQALRIIDSAPVRPRITEMPLAEAQGMYLAEDLSADRDYPPLDKSLMDGFAVRSADLATLPAELRLIGEIPAGKMASRPLESGEAMAIMTGAPLPAGADGVVPVEAVAGGVPSPNAPSICVMEPVTPQRYVSRAGSDIRAGTIILRRGVALEARQLAAAATIGAATVKVCAPPRVAVLATGDEVVSVDARPQPWEVRNANSTLVSALLRRLGCRVIDLGWVPDRGDAVRAALVKGMQLDALVVSGSMSVGRYDLVPQLLRELGGALKVTRLRIKPGKPFVYATADRAVLGELAGGGIVGGVAVQGLAEGTCHIFGLPGNPVSAFVCMQRLASRLLVRLAGGVAAERWLWGRLRTALPANGNREFYQPALVDIAADGIDIEPLQWRGSADLFTLARAGALLVRAEHEGELPAGAMARALQI